MSDAITKALEKCILAAANNTDLDDDFSFGPLEVELNGPGWDGRVDPRVANFVINLQKTRNDLLKFIVGRDLIEDEELEIAIKVEEGCTWFNLDELPKSLMKYVPKKQRPMVARLIIIALIGGSAAYVISNQFLEARRIEAGVHHDDAEVQKLKATIDGMNELARTMSDKKDLEKPMRDIVKSMRDEDTISAPFTAGVEVQKAEAKKSFPNAPKQESTNKTYWGNVAIVGADRKDVQDALIGRRTVRFSLLGSNKINSADVAVSEDEWHALVERLKKPGDYVSTIRVNIKHTAKKIAQITVVNVGIPSKDGDGKLEEFNLLKDQQ